MIQISQITPLKIIRIDLATRKITNEDYEPTHPYFGYAGRSLITHILLNEVPPQCDPLSNENKLIFANGFLSGTQAPNSGRISIGAKSPLTGGVKESNVGGSANSLVARYGILGIIFENMSDDWIWVHLTNEGIKIHSAADIKKQNNYPMFAQFRAEFGKRIGLFGIGLAGYLKFKTASIASSDMQGYPSRHAGRGGLGAVMGSKKIKAIVIDPPKENNIEYSDLEQFQAISRPQMKEINQSRQSRHLYGTLDFIPTMNSLHGLPVKNHRSGSTPEIHKIDGPALHKIITDNGGKYGIPCSPNCAIQCSCLIKNTEGEHVTSSLEYETVGTFGPNLMIFDLTKIAEMDRLCDDLGMDTIEVANTVAMYMEAGKIKWGDADGVIDLLKGVYTQKTESLFVGKGCYDLGTLWGVTRIPHVKKQGLPAYNPRSIVATGITFLTGAQGADHTAGDAFAINSRAELGDISKVHDKTSKKELSRAKQIYAMMADSMGICYFVGFNWNMLRNFTTMITARFGSQLTKNPKQWIAWAKDQLRAELKFNSLAGLQEVEEFPEFFIKESLEDVPRQWSINSADLSFFW